MLAAGGMPFELYGRFYFEVFLRTAVQGGHKFNEYQIYTRFNIHKHKTGSSVMKMQTHDEAKH
jgi:hypothetical protein